jgi:hypothetical protein
VEHQTDVRLAAHSSFSWPAVGRISQTYGCTGFYLNPPRGSCRHFHDGLDIVSGYGSRIHTAADGVVAYAGWNPWDEGGRAWIMVVSHPNGYVTRYGHLIPGALVNVGQFVRQGEAIGKMGSTGKSTGTHLHFELLQGSSPLNPFAYLPAGMVTMKPAKERGKHGKGKHKRGGHGARAKGRDGQRGASARAGDLSPAAIDAPPNGQVFGVDLASVPDIPSDAATPSAACPVSADTLGGSKRHQAKGGAKHHLAKGGAKRHKANAGRRAQANAGSRAHPGGRESSPRRATSADESCIGPTLPTFEPSGASVSSEGMGVDGAGGATVRERAKPRVPDTGSTIGKDRGVPMPRRGTSPTPS